jgi:hypothetical protein
MSAMDIKQGTWTCSHTDEILRCAKCNLIFCGKCHQLPNTKQSASTDRLTCGCPACGELLTITLSPDRDKTAKAEPH